MNYHSHLNPKASAYLDKGVGERAAFIKLDRLYVHPILAAIQNHVRALVTQPRTSRASGVLVHGAPGAGKTQVGLAAQRTFPAVRNGDGVMTQPVVMISLSEARDARMIYTRLLTALGTPQPDKVIKSRDREQLALKLLLHSETRLLVVDETQDVLFTTDYQRQATLNTIKYVMNEIGLPILALGTDEAAKAFTGNQHMAARFKPYQLPIWSNDATARHLLGTIEKWLPLRLPSGLSSAQMTQTIIKASSGSMSEIIRITKDAAIFSILDGSEKITAALVEKAVAEVPPYEIWERAITEEVPHDPQTPPREQTCRPETDPR